MAVKLDTSTFATRQEALAYLKSCGRKVGQSKFYADITRGALRAQADGTFRKRDVDTYAVSLPTLGGVPLKDKDRAARIAIRKAEASAKREEEHAKTLELRRKILEGKYLLRSDVMSNLAARATMLEQNLLARMRTDAPLMVEAVQGNPDETHALYTIFEKSLHTLLVEYVANSEFTVEFTQEALDELNAVAHNSEVQDDE